MRIFIKTLGCKSNRYESDRLGEELGQKHEVLEDFGNSKDSDILIVNTCTVTQVADRKSRQEIYGFKRQNPSAKVIVFGCGTNVFKEDYEKLKEIDFIVKDRKEVSKIVKKLTEKCKSETPVCANPHMERTRALLKIQDGCNNFCTYCIIPKARGPEYSFPSKEIIKEAQKLEKEGHKEIVITGINIGMWKEKKLEIADLLELLIKNTKTVRFRISSIEPKNFSDNFFKLFKSSRLCPHIHMSLQSGSEGVLKRMRRHYTAKEFLEICKKFKKAVPDIGLTTDVIVGFPGETDKEFKETVAFIKKIHFLKLHVFPYSKRKGTAAYYMKDQISDDIKQKRAKILRELSDKMAALFKKSLLGKTYEILVENSKAPQVRSNNLYKGYTPNYLLVQFSCSTPCIDGKKLANTFAKVKLKKVLNNGEIRGERL